MRGSNSTARLIREISNEQWRLSRAPGRLSLSISRRCAGSPKTKSWNMSLADLRDGDRVFIDANVFIYHFGGRSLECKAFLERCARRELLGYTSTPVLAEVLHRRMVAEAIAQGLVTARTAVRKLGETPEVVKQLTQYQEDVSKIPHMHLSILYLTLDIVQASAAVRTGEGLRRTIPL